MPHNYSWTSPQLFICLPRREPSLSTSQHARQRQWELHGEKATSDSAGHEDSHKVLEQDSRVLIPSPRKRIKMLQTPFFVGKQKNCQLWRDKGCPARAHFWPWWEHESTRALCQPLSLGAAPTWPVYWGQSPEQRPRGRGPQPVIRRQQGWTCPSESPDTKWSAG